MLYPSFKDLRLSVRLSVRQRFVFTLCWVHFLTNFFKLGIRVDIRKECLGIADGKFQQISTESWPFD